MARGRAIKSRKVDPDPVYKNRLVTKLINRSMRDGKKSVAIKQVLTAFEMIKKEGLDPIKVFSDAVNNIKPVMEVRPRRIGGAAYQVPATVRGPRRESLAIRWLVAAARARSSSEYKNYAAKLSTEIMEAAKGEGAAVKKKVDTEKMAEANRAFAHFRW
jgi:small subunit ribosomal protein S7